MLLTMLTAPLGIIGVSIGMLLTNQAMGFVAELGILALGGMIIRNSVILIDQIQKHIADGEAEWEAIIDPAVLRLSADYADGGARLYPWHAAADGQYFGADGGGCCQRAFRCHIADLAGAADHVCCLVCVERGRSSQRWWKEFFSK